MKKNIINYPYKNKIQGEIYKEDNDSYKLKSNIYPTVGIETPLFVAKKIKNEKNVMEKDKILRK